MTIPSWDGIRVVMDEFFIVPSPGGFDVWKRAPDGAVSRIHSFPTETSAEAFADYRRDLLAAELQGSTATARRARSWRHDGGRDETDPS